METLRVQSVLRMVDVMAYKPWKYRSAMDFMARPKPRAMWVLYHMMRDTGLKRKMSSLTTQSSSSMVIISHKFCHPRVWSALHSVCRERATTHLCDACMRPLDWFGPVPQSLTMRTTKLIQLMDGGVEESVTTTNIPGALCPECWMMQDWDESIPRDHLGVDLLLNGYSVRQWTVVQQFRMMLENWNVS